MMATIDKYIKALPEVLSALVCDDERLYAKVYQEETQYARLTQALVNQSGGIFQEQLTLFLGNDQAMVSMSVEGDLPSPDQIRGLVQALREDLPHVPRDPWLNLNEVPEQMETGNIHGSMQFDELVNTLCESAGKQDLVGLVLSGPQVFAVCSSLGHCLIHRGGGSSIDVSIFDADYNAVKRVRRDPDLVDILPLVNGMSQDLKALQRPAVNIKAGTYRAWLSAEALGELLGTISWNGFSVDSIRSGSSPLNKLYNGEKQLSPRIHLYENRQMGDVPSFTSEGFLLPAEVPLIQEGRAKNHLSSPRAAKEFDTNINSDSGYPSALYLQGGDLPDNDVLQKIGTGLYIGRLWYTNISDPGSCRLTAMTRYDCFWVEEGVLVGPLSPVRMDSSIYQLLGEDLEAIGAHVHQIPETHSYGQRGWGSSSLPGVMTALKITL
ncbi:metallopeptidase TldD-related protein [Acidithiobacillus thiooxidans]|jgi:predicted Zn-dependent protease|nr:metallopeptidase TldD-related protein [Acidithiobacillus thiooxidans]